MLHVPPTFQCKVPGLIYDALGDLAAGDYRQAALAPKYYTETTSVVWPAFALFTQLAWLFWSLLNRGRDYRSSYAVLRTVVRERGSASLALDRKAPWRKHEGALIGPLAKTDRMYEFLYWMTRESFGLRRWFVLALYIRLVGFPYAGLLVGDAPISSLFPVPLLLIWIVQGLAALLCAQHYYPYMALPVLHAFALPLIMLPWLLLAVYAKTFWRGYQGEAPVMEWPEATLNPPRAVSQGKQEATAKKTE